MTTQAGLEKKEREFLARCVSDAYTMLDLLPGVDPNGPALVWKGPVTTLSPCVRCGSTS